MRKILHTHTNSNLHKAYDDDAPKGDEYLGRSIASDRIGILKKHAEEFKTDVVDGLALRKVGEAGREGQAEEQGHRTLLLVHNYLIINILKII